MSFDKLTIAGQRIEPGRTRDIELPIAADFAGNAVTVPLRVIRAPAAGPVVSVTAAVHGDELNGAGVVRRLIHDPPFTLRTGALILTPVVNVLGFERHSRYLPDRRDLNRSFPGVAEGSLASRYAHTFFKEVIKRCDYALDLHTAAIRRTNFPNVRGDLSDERVARFVGLFGSEIIVSGRGPKGSLRRTACAAGIPTILLEAGEPWKIEPAAVEAGLRGVCNALAGLGMIDGPTRTPAFSVRVDRTKWLRADAGGMLSFHIAPGDVVARGQPIATNYTLLGKKQNVLRAPVAGVALGMTTHPSVKPGDPVCHIAIPKGGVRMVREALKADNASTQFYKSTRNALASSLAVSDPTEH